MIINIILIGNNNDTIFFLLKSRSKKKKNRFREAPNFKSTMTSAVDFAAVIRAQTNIFLYIDFMPTRRHVFVGPFEQT